MQDYSTVTFEAYLEKGNYAELSLAAAFSDKYDFSGTFASINDNFSTYSKHVMEGMMWRMKPKHWKPSSKR